MVHIFEPLITFVSCYIW